MMENMDHAHPCNFRLVRALDRGWGEMAFEYHWDSTSGLQGEDGQSNPDLNACTLYEYTTYPPGAAADISGLLPANHAAQHTRVNQGRHDAGWYYPSDPPFAAWKFRDPTDGRTAPVALGCFSAINGWAWDRHKLAGRLDVPEHAAQHKFNASIEQEYQENLEQIFVIAAMQEYRFHCSMCGVDAIVPGSHSGPHMLLRCFAPRRLNGTTHTSLPQSDIMDKVVTPDAQRNADKPLPLVWRYSFHKHQAGAYLDLNAAGYVDDSAHIGFGP